ncbi:hypothetical protein C4568_04230 [Candidatus Parcubacteria bacterium]|nr:MAG: hypothetical protein C4568_04230 [Candidatus Parcubacteria bacterium]
MKYRGTRAVDLIGLVHFATEGYYQTIQQYLEGLAYHGYHIFCEGIDGESETESTDDTDPALLLWFEMVEMMILAQQKLAEAWGLVIQTEHLRGSRYNDLISGSWICVDLPAREAAQMLCDAMRDEPNFETALRSSICFWRHDPDAAQRRLGEALLKGQQAPDTALPPEVQRVGKIIIDARNEYLLRMTLRTRKDRPLAYPWGAGHLPGIARALEAEGQECVSVEWIPAFKIP